ncbi:Tagatose-6-phosphate kinase [Neomoorella glycerini]|uniref:Tagatose-6-phosphate kinase n=1 Tax=Neomoorella glycerini TaxID=55779 RepID=A0A6I5ZSG1_9FIRM|nr:1-phosphofructokinase [Moorella glycerini]QGP92535.1 Tagatose-6-phosphate kinase [Moorella glycerini]
MITTVTVNTAIDKTYIVENFGINGVFRVQRVMAQAGGKGLNVARVVKALGEEVVATGFLGGHNGRFFADNLVAERIKGDFVPIAGETRICLNILDPAGKTQTELLEPGPEVSVEEGEKLREKVRVLARHSRVVTMSGSLAQGLPSDYYAQLIEMAHQEGTKVILDTSGTALLEGLKARPFMVKPNLQEAEALTGKPLNDETARWDFLCRLLNAGVEIAVLSLGEEGALFATGNNFFRVTPPEVQVINTVGCGDAFVAGFAVALARGEDVPDAARLATAAAAANAASLGTGQCNVEVVEKLIAQVELFYTMIK